MLDPGSSSSTATAGQASTDGIEDTSNTTSDCRYNRIQESSDTTDKTREEGGNWANDAA